MTTPKLLPCPFCGGEPSLEGDYTGYYVRCLSCEQPFQQATPEKAKKVWNTRPNDKVIGKVREALEYYANEFMYEEITVYRGEHMSGAYQVDIVPILEGEKYHVAQEALTLLDAMMKEKK